MALVSRRGLKELFVLCVFVSIRNCWKSVEDSDAENTRIEWNKMQPSMHSSMFWITDGILINEKPHRETMKMKIFVKIVG